MDDKKPIAGPSTPLPARKRGAPGMMTPNLFSAAKRRRMSLADDDREFDEFGPGHASSSKIDVSDRFISAPKEHVIPLQSTPRTQRMAKYFGLANDRVLQYTDTNGEKKNTFLNRHRFNFHQLKRKPHKVSPSSAESHLGTRKQFLLALDGPGIPHDIFAYPMSWSSRNAIAVACGYDVYFQELDTRRICHLFKLPQRNRGRLVSIEWAPELPQLLAAGTMNGEMHLWDAEAHTELTTWRARDEADVGGLSWCGNVLAVGLGDGGITLYDHRSRASIARLDMHRDKVHGLRWRHDGHLLASSDQSGVVQLWDSRASKALTADKRHGRKLKHHAPLKALAWCPWKPELLATGTMYPDGKIRIWNVNDSNFGTSPPAHLLSLNTSVTSLLWSPHCKELLSTHGVSWLPRGGASDSCPNLPSSASAPGSSPSPAGTGTGAGARRDRPVSAKTALTNALAVHAFPSLRRVVSVPAHQGPIGHACLGPDGTGVFTICPYEEAMKMWRVWGPAEKAPRQESVFDRCTIR